MKLKLYKHLSQVSTADVLSAILCACQYKGLTEPVAIAEKEGAGLAS